MLRDDNFRYDQSCSFPIVLNIPSQACKTHWSAFPRMSWNKTGSEPAEDIREMTIKHNFDFVCSQLLRSFVLGKMV